MAIRYVITTRDNEAQETALETLENEIQHFDAPWTIEAGKHIDVILSDARCVSRLQALLSDNLNQEEYTGKLIAAY